MEPLTIRLPEDLYEAIEKAKGTKKKSDFIRDIIREHFQNTEKDNVSATEYERLQTELKHKDEIIELLDARILDLQTQLGWIQTALPAPRPKKWWQLWRSKPR